MTARRPRTVLALVALLWLLCLMVAPFIGSQAIGLGDLLAAEPTAATIVWQIRLPRVLLALLGGGALALCGLCFQTVFRNPLAEPYTLGIAGGAALGAVLAVALEPFVALGGLPWVGVASFAGALVVTLVILGLAASPVGVDSSTLLLAGIAISLSCSALILLLQYMADFTRTFRMVRWMMGGLAVVGYREVLWLLPFFIVGATLLFIDRWELDLLLTGEEVAASRGLDVRRFRWRALGASCLMIGALVAVAGPIGFVGLIVPHILRRLVGHHHALLLPACVLGGGAFLALCDTVARRVMAPAELPVGVLTALLGGPFFLWLLLTERRSERW